MNLSKIAIENAWLEQETVSNVPELRRQAQDIAEIIDALEKVQASTTWKVLQKKLFDQVLTSLQNRLRREKDTIEIFRLQGQIAWAEKYCDLASMTESYRNTLTNLKKQIHHE